jgi:glycosyltransferase involved in cell wall biosynthesis
VSGAGPSAEPATVGSVSAGGRRVLILVENLSVPLDRRVWQESLALRAAGYEVVVVCPRGDVRDTEAHVVLEGVEIHRFPLAPASGAVGYLREYAQAVWRIARLVARLSRGRRFDIVHACNPPDVLLLAALPLRRRGTRFVFDHHDLVPELYLSRYRRGRDLLHRALLLSERLAFRLADVVVATNESYREVALTRGRMGPEDVFVVRNGPDVERLRPGAPDETLRRGKPHLVAYVGMMGPQDGVDHALRALAVLAESRDDWHALFVGDGDAVPAMRTLTRELGLEGRVEFTGLVGQDDVVRVLSTADVCLAPEPSNPLNDLSTMIKVGEYMAMARPVAAYDLRETRWTAGDAALYAPANDPRALAACVDRLLSDAPLRERLGRAGRARAESVLAWRHSVAALLAAYDRALTRVAA